jgi:hypothetical protein
MTDMVEPYMLSLITEPIIQPQENIILKKQPEPEPITDSSVIMDIPVKEMKRWDRTSRIQTLLGTQYLIILSKIDNDSFLKVCENNNIIYPNILIKRDDACRYRYPDSCSKWKREYMTDKLVERFKEYIANIRCCLASLIHSLYSKHYRQIIKHISISPHYIEEYCFAIVYSSMCNLTPFIGDE